MFPIQAPELEKPTKVPLSLKGAQRAHILLAAGQNTPFIVYLLIKNYYTRNFFQNARKPTWPRPAVNLLIIKAT
jgi:hypothetical protein